MGCVASLQHSETTEIRLLLQGIGSCGKSTFAKQMRIIHSHHFIPDELARYKSMMVENIFLGLKELAEVAQDAGKHVKDKKLARYVGDLNPYRVEWNKDAASMAQALYADPTMEYARDNLPKTEFAESLDYCIRKIDDLLNPAWIPGNDDVLRARCRTTGKTETQFKSGNTQVSLIDAGGQSVERRKWAQIQGNINGMLYFSAVDEWTDPSEEDESKTKLDLSLEVWDQCIHNEEIAGKVAIILFLNKADLLARKMKLHPKSFRKTFKDFPADGDAGKALGYLRNLFLSKIRPDSPLKQDQIYVHATCALDTSQMSVVFTHVKDFVVQQRMKVANLM